MEVDIQCTDENVKSADDDLAELLRLPSHLHKLARKYAKQGLAVFPCVPNAKKPACEHGVKEATTDLAQIDLWWAIDPAYNIGCDVHQSGWCVVDAEAEASVEWQAELPETYTIQTPGGGFHYYFKGELPNTARKLAPFIDTRGGQGGKAGYVLLAGSVVDDKPYRVVKKAPVVLLPAWVKERLAAKPARTEAAEFTADTEANIARARRYLRGLAPVVEGEGSDAKAYEVAAVLREMGLSEYCAALIMYEDFKCTPKDLDWVREKVRNAYAYAQNAAGVDARPQTGAEIFANNPALQDLKADEAGPIAFSTVLTRVVGPVHELIPGLIEKGIPTFLSGPGGTHKSRTALHWGLCLAAGLPVYGRAVEQTQFLYLSYEDSADEVARRAQGIAKRINLPTELPALYWDLRAGDNALAYVSDGEGVVTLPFWDRLRAHLQSTPGHKFLVADSAYNILQFVGAAKINEASVKAGIELLARLCAEVDCTLLVLWHPSQAGQERGDSSGWSVAWHNTPRARLSISVCRDGREMAIDGAFELKVEKRNNGPKGSPLALYWDNGVLLPVSDFEAGQRNSLLHEACVQVAIEAAKVGNPILKQPKVEDWRREEIERRCGFKPNDTQIKGELSKALRDGKLRYVKGHGKNKAGYFPFAASTDGYMPEGEHG